MAINALKKITKRATEIYARGGTYRGAMKQAAAEYRAEKKKKKTKVGYAPYTRKKMKEVTKVARKKKAARPSLTNKRAVSSVKIGSVSSIESHLKRRIAEQIGWYEATKMSAKTAKSKREVGKKIAALKTKYRKLV